MATKLGPEPANAIRAGLQNIEKHYGERRYTEVLREVLSVSETLFGPQVHRYSEGEEVGRRFIREIHSQNEAFGDRACWEESLVSIYALDLVLRATKI
ncbi:MAG: hypothetical protein HQL31_12115 [Planctomycetes bacterium]|nr:hypothetical protein [Planctomycetota bacterium]